MFFIFLSLQRLHDDGSKPMMKFREPDYAGQYSPWSCETIGSYIGTKDAKPKDVMVTVAMDMMVRADTDLNAPIVNIRDGKCCILKEYCSL